MLNKMEETVNKDYIGNGIYKENIMDNYKNPRNLGKMKNP